MAKPDGEPAVEAKLLTDLRGHIQKARSGVAQAVNSALVSLYWHVGNRIRTENLEGGRAEYGEQIVTTLSKELTAEFGRGFSDKNLRHMIRFSEVFPDPEIVSALSRQLGWAHFRLLLYSEDPLKRASDRRDALVVPIRGHPPAGGRLGRDE